MKIFNCDDDDELPTTMKHEDAPEMNAGTSTDFFIFFLQLPPVWGAILLFIPLLLYYRISACLLIIYPSFVIVDKSTEQWK